MNALHDSSPYSTSLADLFFYGSEEDILEVAVFEPAISAASIPESLIHSIWQNQHLDPALLGTHAGHSIIVHNAGTLNSDTGPDFLNAALTIHDTLWHGDIEIHKTSKDWYAHNHHLDARYNSTILHVTLFSDHTTGSIVRENGSLIPELVLESCLKTPLRPLLYAHLTRKQHKLPCAEVLHSLTAGSLTTWLKNLGTMRLLRKKRQIEHAFLHNPRLEHILYELLLTGLGYAKNCTPMMELSRRISLHTSRSLNNAPDREALYLGISGLLPDVDSLPNQDPASIQYLKEMRDRFNHINGTLKIPCMTRHAWQFFRLRPSNFPTLRVAQAAALFNKEGLLHVDATGLLANLLSRQTNTREKIASIRKLLQPAPSSFWRTHYRFHTTVASKPSTMGKMRGNKILLNAILPVMMMYADQRQNIVIEDAIFQILKTLQPEKDTVTKLYKNLALDKKNSQISQGLHELHTQYCRKGKCLTCNIGISLLNNNLCK